MERGDRLMCESVEQNSMERKSRIPRNREFRGLALTYTYALALLRAPQELSRGGITNDQTVIHPGHLTAPTHPGHPLLRTTELV